MTDHQNLPTTSPSNTNAKKWVFFAIFFGFAIIIYSSTMYRIRSAGFMGTKNDQLAHPEQVNKDAPLLRTTPTK